MVADRCLVHGMLQAFGPAIRSQKGPYVWAFDTVQYLLPEGVIANTQYPVVTLYDDAGGQRTSERQMQWYGDVLSQSSIHARRC